MGLRTFQVTQWTPIAVADNTNFTDGGHQSLLGGNATQLTHIREVSISGLAAAAALTILQLARHSTIAITPTALAAPNSDTFNNPICTALADTVKAFIASSTKPKADQVGKIYPFAFDAWGGIVRKVWEPGELCMYGNAVTNGELGLNAYDGTGDTPGSIMSSISYETE